jgi:hypothetical protein
LNVILKIECNFEKWNVILNYFEMGRRRRRRRKRFVVPMESGSLVV